MAHPADRTLADVAKEQGRLIHLYLGLAILADWGSLHFSTEQVGHQLRTIADAKDRNTKLKYLPVITRRGLPICTVRSPGKDDSFGIHFPDLFQAQCMGMHFTIHIAFPDTSGDQLIILSTKIQYDDKFLFQCCLLLLVVSAGKSPAR